MKNKRRILKITFIVVFAATLLWSPVLFLVNGVIPLYLLLAELDLYFCLKYFLGSGAEKGRFRGITNGSSMVSSMAVLLLYMCELILCSLFDVRCIYTSAVGEVLYLWTIAYVCLRTVYAGVTDVIDKKHSENVPMWLLDEDVLLKGRVKDGKFYPDSDKCGFYAQSIDCTMYGRSLFESLEEAIAVCGELPVIDSESYIEE